jgi:hypothetical protein
MTNIGSSLSANLQSRAQNLHANSNALDKQEKDLVKATEGLRKETDKLGKMAAEGQKKVKELGNVQNWAEMLERDFLVLEETLRLARKGSEDSYSGSYSGSSYSGSEDGERDLESLAGDERRGKVFGTDVGLMAFDVDGDVDMDGSPAESPGPPADVAYEDAGKGKGRAVGLDEDMGEQEFEPGTVHAEERHVEQEADQRHEAVGGSSTATIASGSDPSTSSVHTSASTTS